MLAATGVQTAGVLDDLYDARTAHLGPVFRDGVPTLSVWAPTAQSVPGTTAAPAAQATPGSTTVAATGWAEPLTSTWSRRALAALLIPALILLIVVLI